VSNIKVLQLRSAGVSLVLDCSGPGLPSVLHWGADLGELTDAALADFRRGAGAVQVGNGLDENQPVALIRRPGSVWRWWSS
jgi:alpha-galactosidase